jgi:uncharacterized protein YegJ (DUF2314 family)
MMAARRHLGFCLALITLAGPAWSEGKIHEVPKSAPAMAAAIAGARQTLDLFLSHALDAEGLSLPPADIKVGIPTPGTGEIDEFIWFTPFQRLPDGTFNGVSTDDAVLVPGLKSGDVVNFTIEQVIDWSWHRNQPKVWGDYTTRVIAAREGLSPMDLYGKPWADNPIPPAWR